MNFITSVTKCYYTCDLYYICDELLHLCVQQQALDESQTCLEVRHKWLDLMGKLLISKIAPPFSIPFLLSLPLLVSKIAPPFSIPLISCSLSRCSSVTLFLLSLSLSLSLSRCSSVQFRLLSIALCRSLSLVELGLLAAYFPVFSVSPCLCTPN